MFSEKEISYLQSQRLARIATVSADGEPDVAPVLFTFDGGRFLVGGIELRRTLKYTNAQATGRAAIVVDEFPNANPPQPRGIKVHGTTQVIHAHAHLGSSEYIEITPEKYWNWGIEAPAFSDGKPIIKKLSRQNR
jgi:pyridoxamine 5'-phosphate oxidase family protein